MDDGSCIMQCPVCGFTATGGYPDFSKALEGQSFEKMQLDTIERFLEHVCQPQQS